MRLRPATDPLRRELGINCGRDHAKVAARGATVCPSCGQPVGDRLRPMDATRQQLRDLADQNDTQLRP